MMTEFIVQAVVGVVHGGGEAAHEVQGGFPVFSRREYQEGVDSGKGLLLLPLPGPSLRGGFADHRRPPVREYSPSRALSSRGTRLGEVEGYEGIQALG